MFRLASLVFLAVFATSALAFQAPDTRVSPAELAAKAQDDPAAALALADMYEQGRGVEADPREALAWRRRAAELGDVAAQFDLGLRFEHGWGAPRDPEASRYWLQRAADGGSGEARRALDRALLRDSARERAVDSAHYPAAAAPAPAPRVVPAPESEQPEARRPAPRGDTSWQTYEAPAEDWVDRRPRLSLGWGISGGSRHWGWSAWDGYPDPWYASPWYPGIVAGGWYPFGWYDWGWAGHRSYQRGRHAPPRARAHLGIGVRH